MIQRFICLLGILVLLNPAYAQRKNLPYYYRQADKADSILIRNIYNEALAKGECYENLRHLCKKIGARLSGSPQAAKAVDWGKEVLEKMGCDTVFLQPVWVTQWVRGTIEECVILSTNRSIAGSLDACALGGSVATPSGGLKAQIVEVKGLEELKVLGEAKIKGKIVFYNRPMDSKLINTFQAYGGCVNQRVDGANEAAKYGAVAVLVRSMTLAHDDHPHTGVLHYDSLGKKIPAAALSTNSADELSSKLRKDNNLQVYLNLDCKTLPDVLSHNVVGELRGTLFPNKYILVGGHLDSWDKGEGAHDDGAGVVQSMEVLRLLKRAGVRPRHSIRAVLFMNEENGARGAKVYAEAAQQLKQFHLFAIESDAGGHTPRGFSMESDTVVLRQVQMWKNVLAPYGLTDLAQGGSGVDVGPLRKQGTVTMGYRPDSQRYFDFHHAETDVFENVHKRELELGAAGMTALVYLLDKYFDDSLNIERYDPKTTSKGNKKKHK